MYDSDADDYDESVGIRWRTPLETYPKAPRGRGRGIIPSATIDSFFQPSTRGRGRGRGRVRANTPDRDDETDGVVAQVR